MALDTTDKNFIRTASFLGIIQGTTWTILSLLCLIFFYNDTKDIQVTTWMEEVGAEWYYLFIKGKVSEKLYIDLKSNVFAGFMWVYFFTELLWIFISLYMFLQKNERNLVKILTAWSHLTLLISVWDFITVAILGADYDKCMNFAADLSRKDHMLPQISVELQCATGELTVLVLAARGFVLWIVNIVLAVVLMKMAKRFKNSPDVQDFTPTSIGYQIPHPSVRPQNSGYGQYPPTPTAPPNFNRDKSYIQYPPSPSTGSFSPSTPQNMNRNKFEYPSVPEPDYHRFDARQTPPVRRY